MRAQRRSVLFALKITGLAGTLSAVAFLGGLPGFAQQMHRNRFESTSTSWIKSNADAPFAELVHAISDQNAHDGQRSEYIQINAKQGNYVHYLYRTGRAPLGEELNMSTWIKANRPGVQLLARVVLPNERDPNNLDDRLTTLIRGDVYRDAGRWKLLSIGRPVALAKQQQQLMQAQLRRAVNFTDAYVDALILNVYTGPGTSEVWIDDLAVGPTLDPTPANPRLAKPETPPITPKTGRRSEVVEFNGSNLLVDGKRFFFRGIRHTDTPIRELRKAGFNTLFLDHSSDPALLQEAADARFWLVPSLPVATEANHLVSEQSLARDVQRFSEVDSVLFWNMGNALAFEQTALVSRSAQLVRGVDRQRPLGGDAWDGLMRYSNTLNLLGVHRWPLMSTLELSQYRDWIEQRGRLASPGTFLWTWIQTHTPEWYTQLIYDRPTSAGFTEPIGPQPEQIRLLTYTAVGAGCRGLAYWSDRFLADTHQGRDRLLCLALLNQELQMLEPLLTTVDGQAEWISTSSPEVKAAVLRGPKGVLVLPMWQGSGAQYVPGQAAVRQLTLIVPQVPGSMQAWEVTPGEVRGLRWENEPGRIKVTLPEFGLTTAVVFTSDIALIASFQQQARAYRRDAAQWTYDMATQEFAKVQRVQTELERAGQTLPDAGALMQDAQNRLKTAKEHWDGRLYSDAYRESQRALRPVRILMRAQWEKATKDLDTPVASPYALSFYTLPRHWQFMTALRRSTPTPNVLPGGDFEAAPHQPQDTWLPQDTTLDNVEMLAQRVTKVWAAGSKPASPKSNTWWKEKAPAPTKAPERTWAPPKEGKQCLMLEVRPKPNQPTPKALERTYLAINSPTAKLPPGSLAQISGWVYIPEPITASPDGALLYDSAGGEPLAIRLTAATGWKKFTLYRRVPASGSINVTLALTGIGTVFFDDVRIEPLVWSANPSVLWSKGG
jgi:hypothetical protein